MAINPAYWPESVAFKRLVRDLVRQANYVPPYQDPTNPTLAAAPASTPANQTEAALQVGQWTLTTNERGDVIWKHENGYVQTAAQLPEEPE